MFSLITLYNNLIHLIIICTRVIIILLYMYDDVSEVINVICTYTHKYNIIIHDIV